MTIGPKSFLMHDPISVTWENDHGRLSSEPTETHAHTSSRRCFDIAATMTKEKGPVEGPTAGVAMAAVRTDSPLPSDVKVQKGQQEQERKRRKGGYGGGRMEELIPYCDLPLEHLQMGGTYVDTVHNKKNLIKQHCTFL